MWISHYTIRIFLKFIWINEKVPIHSTKPRGTCVFLQSSPNHLGKKLIEIGKNSQNRTKRVSQSFWQFASFQLKIYHLLIRFYLRTHKATCRLCNTANSVSWSQSTIKWRKYVCAKIGMSSSPINIEWCTQCDVNSLTGRFGSEKIDLP